MFGRLVRHVHRHGVGYVALFIALGGSAVAAGPAVKGDLTQIIAGAGVSVSPGGDQTGAVTVGVTKAPDADLLDGVNSAAFGRTTASGTLEVAFGASSTPITLPLTGVQIYASCRQADTRLDFDASLTADAGAGAVIHSFYPWPQPIANERNVPLGLLSFPDNINDSSQFADGVRTFVLDTSGKTIVIASGASIYETAAAGHPQGCTFNWQATESANAP